MTPNVMLPAKKSAQPKDRFEREREASRQARREAFANARRAGLSMREIAEAAGLHHSSVSEIIEDK